MDLVPLQPCTSLPSPLSPSPTSTNRKKSSKSHVATACVNCKKAHLGCDLSRPCKRCVAAGKTDTCYDIQHKKRGRPKLRDKRITPSWKHNHGSSSGNGNNNNDFISTSSVMTVVPALAPGGFAQSSFTMTRSPSHQESISAEGQAPKRPKIMTMFLSIDLGCARVSDESLELLGLYPQELAQRSLYELITPDDTQTLSRIHRCLLSARSPGIQSDVPSTSDLLVSLPPSSLLSIANGSQTFKEKLGLRRRDDDGEVLLDARFYLGGGLGADLFVPASLNQLYIVCLLTPTNATRTSSSPRPITPKRPQQLPSQPQAVASEATTITTTSQPLALPPSTPTAAQDQPTCWPAIPDTSASRDESTDHRLVWMHPHDCLYPSANPKGTMISAVSTTDTATASNPFTSTSPFG